MTCVDTAPKVPMQPKNARAPKFHARENLNAKAPRLKGAKCAPSALMLVLVSGSSLEAAAELNRNVPKAQEFRKAGIQEIAGPYQPRSNPVLLPFLPSSRNRRHAAQSSVARRQDLRAELFFASLRLGVFALFSCGPVPSVT